jgi:predicted nucleotidyltransferase
MISKKTINEAARRLVEKFHPERIILFGSQARGTADKRSDIDLLVIYPSKKNRMKLMVEMNRSLNEINYAFDIVILSPREYEIDSQIPGTLARYVSRDGKVIYEAAKK